MELASIGKNIRRFRLAAGMRKEDLAEKADLSTNYIGALERGEKIPALETFIVIANILEVSSDLLLSEVLDTGYIARSSLIANEIEALSPEDRARIFDVIETMIKHSKKQNN